MPSEVTIVNVKVPPMSKSALFWLIVIFIDVPSPGSTLLIESSVAKVFPELSLRIIFVIMMSCPECELAVTEAAVSLSMLTVSIVTFSCGAGVTEGAVVELIVEVGDVVGAGVDVGVEVRLFWLPAFTSFGPE